MAITLDVKVRTGFGRGASRRLRRAAEIPAIITGKGEAVVCVTLSEQKLILAALKEEFFKEPVTLNDGGKTISARVAEVQRHPVSGRILHLDFLRV